MYSFLRDYRQTPRATQGVTPVISAWGEWSQSSHSLCASWQPAASRDACAASDQCINPDLDGQADAGCIQDSPSGAWAVSGAGTVAALG
ncbi:hypothetical protein NDU88_000817 [Pleurodeles waltl]|uniref:Uncharacterized protein n=1 Tax=Pleurodeles waltl TaxID=8319 RepID=A0AAV7Q560_PLEWA|nr:hypothetical protein NDU88_000817 [Pleurodeles waltl]